MYLLGEDEMNVKYHINSISLEYCLNCFWDDDDALNNCDLFAAVDDDIVGFLAIRKNESSIYVEMIETIESGYGRKIIKELFKMYPDVTSIEGEALSVAIPFWEKIGAKFFFETIEERFQALDSYDCFMFSLKKDNFK